jgi:phosphate transport system substrate-binding protein
VRPIDRPTVVGGGAIVASIATGAYRRSHAALNDGSRRGHNLIAGQERITCGARAMDTNRRDRVALSFLIALMPSLALAQVRLDERLPDYKPTEKLSGNLASVGNDTMNNLMTLWHEEFEKLHPGVRMEIDGKGSTTAVPALIAGRANFGPMSRGFKDAEVKAFRKQFGEPPVAVAAALDVMAIYVHKNNPIESLSLAQLDAMFSKTRRRGYPEDITIWGQVGLKGKYSQAKISMYSRNSASGYYAFFKQSVLAKGDFKDSVREQPSGGGPVQGVASDPFGIGYQGIGYKTADVRAVPLSVDGKSKPVRADVKHALSGEYPLARRLVIALRPPGKDGLPALEREFLRFVLSRQGQRVVIKDGYFPLAFDVAAAAAKKVGIVLGEPPASREWRK